MRAFIQDLRFGVRMLLKQPGFTLIAVLTLALGIGANTAMFSVVNAVLLRPLPFPEPDRLMMLATVGIGNFAAPDFRDVASRNRSFEHLGAYSSATFNLSGGGEPERVNGAHISADLLPALGVQPLYGRNLVAEEEREGGEKVVLLSHGLWQRQFGADANVVGRTVRVDEQSYTVIGVMPPNLNFPRDKELFVPLAKRYWPNANPIGQRIKETANGAVWREIVGIVGSVRHSGREAEPRPEMFVPWNQVPALALNVAVRTQAEPASVAITLRRAVAAIDSNLPVFEVLTMEERLSESVAQPRFHTTLLVIFSVLALLMAVVGLYAVIAVLVAQRTHEIGIRLALGAERRDVIKLVLRQGIKLVTLGVVMGLAGALALTRVLTTLLFEVKPTDPLTFMAVPVLLIVVAVFACWLPARQAAKVDPLLALRYE